MRHVKSSLVHTDCLFRYDEPVSPHLAAKLKATDDVFATVCGHLSTLFALLAKLRHLGSVRPDSCRLYCRQN